MAVEPKKSSAGSSDSPLSSPSSSIISEAMVMEEIRVQDRSNAAEVFDSDADADDMDESHDSITVGVHVREDSPSSEPATRSLGARRTIRLTSKIGPSAQAKAAATRKAKAEAKKWEAPFVLTHENSPLGFANLRDILLLPRAWDVLDPGEKQLILSLLPDKTHVLRAGTDDACPDLVSLRNDNNFRHDCSQYTDNIKKGKHDEIWLQEAWTAHEKRKRGDYDDFDVRTFERDWNMDLPPEFRPKRRCVVASDTASTTISGFPAPQHDVAGESPDELGGNEIVVQDANMAATDATSPAATSEPNSNRSGSSNVGKRFSKVRIANSEPDELSIDVGVTDDPPARPVDVIRHDDDPDHTRKGEVKDEPQKQSSPDMKEESAQKLNHESHGAEIISELGGDAFVPEANASTD